jgi:predicted permease
MDAGRLVLLFLDCWRLALAELPVRLLGRSRTGPPFHRREPLIVFFTQLRHAFRRLWREPGFTTAAALTLALGVGANVAVFTLVEALLLRPLPYERADELVIVRHRDQGTGVTKEFIAIGDYVDLGARQRTMHALSGYGEFQATIYEQGEPFQTAALGATPELLSTLGFRPFLGRELTAEDAVTGAAPVVILSYDLWQNRFNRDSAVVGRSIRFSSGPREVIGIAPPGFRFPPSAATGVILSMTLPAEAPAQRKSGWTFAAARLQAGQTLETANAELAAISRELEQEHPEQNRGSTYYAVSLRDETVGDARKALVLLLAAVGTVLLIACANVANLLLARSLARQREMAVRLTLGAGRGRLVSQMLIESLALALVAGGAGLLLAFLGSRALAGLLPRELATPAAGSIQFNLVVVGFAAGVTLLTALATGLVAAMTTPLANAAGMLVVAGRATMSAANRRATSGLVAIEMAMAVALLIGAGLILRSFTGLLAIDPGFDGQRVLTMQINLPADRYEAVEGREAFYAQAFQAIGAVPGVESSGAAVVVPLTGNNWTVGFERADQPVPAGERPPDVGWQFASGGYFTTLRIPLLAGRVFDERDRPSTAPVVIVSQAVEKKFFGGTGSAVGKRIRLGPTNTAEIVGVVGDIRRAGLTDAPSADLYFPFERGPSGGITLFIRTAGDPEAAAAPIRAALRAIESQVAILETRSMAQVAGESLRVTRLVFLLLGSFALIALGLAAVGIYGVMSYVVRQRTREIGTRIALGAARPDILWLVMREGLAIAGLGVAVGLAVGLGGARALRSMLFGVGTGDPLVLAGAATVLVVTALVACYIPALRASAVDPARTLAEQ